MSKDKELSDGFEVDEKIAEEIRTQLEDSQLSCVKAHLIAKQFEVSPAVIGHTVDALDIRLTKCQLGLYGYRNKQGWDEAGVMDMVIPEDFAKILRYKAAEEELTCLKLWGLAAEYGVSRMQAGYITDKLDIRINNCQLGAF